MANNMMRQLRHMEIAIAILEQTDYNFYIAVENGITSCVDNKTGSVMFDDRGELSFREAFTQWCASAIHRDGRIGIAPF